MCKHTVPSPLVLVLVFFRNIKLAFTARVRCHAQWQSAEGELRRVKQVYEKARSQGRIPQDRVGHSFAQIAEVFIIRNEYYVY